MPVACERSGANDNDQGDVIDAEGVARLVGASRKMVYEGAAGGAIPCRRVGRRFIFFRPAIVAWVAGEELCAAPIAANDNVEAMTAEAVAGLLGVDRKTVYEAAARGELPCRRLRRRVLFYRPALISWLWGCKATSHRQGEI